MSKELLEKIDQTVDDLITVFDFGKSEYVVVNETIEEVSRILRRVKTR